MGKWSIHGTFLLVVMFVGCLPCHSLDIDPEEIPKESELHARQFWMQADKDLKTAVSKIIRKAMPVVMKEIYKKDISTTCLSTLLQFTSALKQSKKWAYLMLDSSGRIPEGFLQGTVTSMGNYDECLAINVNETKLKLRGQYCTIEIHPPLPVWKPFTPLHQTVPELLNISAPDSVITYIATMLHNLHVVSVKLGICTPSPCTREDISHLVQIIPEKLNLKWKFEVKHCEIEQDLQFTKSQLIVLYVVGIVFLLLIVGTAVDIMYPSEKMEKKGYRSTIFEVTKCFSALSNAQKLSDWTCPQAKLGFVYGIIFHIYYWVVISDTFMYVNYDTTANTVEAFKILKELFYEIMLNRIFPLQVLFFISGLMTAFRYLKDPDEGLNIVKFFLKKYWRYTPQYALTLALLLVTPTWGSGPSWFSRMNPMYKNCRDHWWYNILYINNFMDSSEVCLDHTWVFAVYAQLHVLSVFILIPLKMRPRIGLLVNFLLAVVSLASVALTNVYYDLPPNEMLTFIHVKDRMFYAEHSYYRVYTHLTMYCCGIFVAFLVHEYSDLKISKKMSWFLWIITLTGFAASSTVVHEWNTGLVPSPLVSALYTSFSKVAEAAFLSWVSVACMTGHGGLIKDYLSWRPFAFLARLVFLAHLMHVPVITMVNGFRKSHFFVNELEIFYEALTNMVATLVIAYILFMGFEAPFISLTQLLTKKFRNRLNSNDMEPPITEKPIKFADKMKNTVSTSPQLKVWMNINEKSRC